MHGKMGIIDKDLLVIIMIYASVSTSVSDKAWPPQDPQSGTPVDV